ncbi:MAG: hypothetical protein HY885_07665 [Deltaproteobacteria bacterium]|nr:hypothetical protein [Deltaproteobacteria bacterium]
MDQYQLDEVARNLKAKGALKPCPRCDSSNFSIIGESEIVVEKLPPKTPGGLLGGLYALGVTTKTTMPIVVIACDNCGYISQHAKAALVTSHPAGLGLLGRSRNE